LWHGSYNDGLAGGQDSLGIYMAVTWQLHGSYNDGLQAGKTAWTWASEQGHVSVATLLESLQIEIEDISDCQAAAYRSLGMYLPGGEAPNHNPCHCSSVE
jgi:hypothetical protein